MNAQRKAGALAIDHGARHSGFAAVDALRLAPVPLAAWRGSGDSDALLDHIAALLAERDIGTLVVGWPMNMDGSIGPRATAVGAFVERLRQRFPAVAVALQDERLSSKAAEELMREAGLRGKDARANRDSFAALVVLRDWIAAGEPG